MATPTGSITPTQAVPSGAVGARAAGPGIAGHPPLRLLLALALASAAVLGLVHLLMVKLGLPDWVFPAAVLLLVIGWPVLLAAGRFERRLARAQAAGARHAPPGGLAGWLTLRKALLGGGAAFGGLALIVAPHTMLRLLGVGPLG